MLRGGDDEHAGGGDPTPAQEPMLLLKASTRMVTTMLRAAIETADEAGHGNHPTIRGWRRTLEQMILWRERHPGKVVDP